MSNKIKIILPPIDDDYLSSALRLLTERIAKTHPESLSHGLLGGEYGYGANYVNKIFIMHPYCWCEQDECGWCSGKNPNFRHIKSGLKVWWYKYIGRGMEVKGARNLDICKVMMECLESVG